MEWFRRISLKTLTGDTVYLNNVLKCDTTVCQLKQIYSHRRDKFRPNYISFFYKGMELDEKTSPSLSDYGLEYGCSVTVIIKTRGFHQPIKELENFLELFEDRKITSKGNIVKHQVEKKKIETGFEKIIWCGVNGPLLNIFRCIDPLELLYNFVLVNKGFYEVVFHIISNRLIELSECHLHSMFRQKLHINESLFLKLASFPNFWDEDTKINLFAYSYKEPIGYKNYGSNQYIDKLNLLQICVVLNFPKGFRYLIEKRNFQQFYLRKTIDIRYHGDDCVRLSPFDYLGESCQNNSEEIFHYIIDKRLNSGFHLSGRPLLNLLLSGDWIRFLKLIEDDRNTIGSCYNSRPRIIIDSYGKCLKDKPEFGTLSKWKELEMSLVKLEKKNSIDFLYEGEDFNKSPIRPLGRGFPYMEMKLLDYILNRKIIKFNFPSYIWTPELSNRMDFVEYVIDMVIEKEVQNLNIYVHKPRFLLMKEAMAGNLKKVKEMIEKKEYKRRKDQISPFSIFPYSKIKDLRIVDFLIKCVPARPNQVKDVEENGNIELAQILKKNIWKEKRLI